MVAARFVTTDGRITLTWTSLQSDTLLRTRVSQDTVDGKGGLLHSVELSAHYVAATSATRVAFDTTAPGYAAAWMFDFTRPWSRDILTSGTAPNGDTMFTTLSEDVTPGSAGGNINNVAKIASRGE